MIQFFKNKLKSKFFVIYLLTFTNGLSFAMLIPVLPFIVRNYNQPEIFLWFLLATYSLFQFIATPIIWALSDRYGRRSLLLITQGGTLLAWIVLWVAYLMPEVPILWLTVLPILVVFLSRALDGVTGGNSSVAQAVIADRTNKNNRTQAFWQNGAVMWFAIIVWPALGSFSMGISSHWFLWTAILWAIISVITLSIIYFKLEESHPVKERTDKIKINARNFNFFSQIKKWYGVGVINYASVMRLFIFVAFISYTSISALYLLDNFGFNEKTVGYYLAFAGSFVIFHQSVTVKWIVNKFWDRMWIMIWLWLLWGWFLWQAFAGDNLITFTVANFFAIAWVSTCFSTDSGLFSKSVDEKQQWEVLGYALSIQSFISIWVPPIATIIYTSINFSIYYIIWIIPLIWLLFSLLLYWKPKYQKNKA